jgi:hypothetical protein
MGERGRGGVGAELYDHKKACYKSFNTLCVILYVHPPILHPLPLPLTPPPFPDSYEGNPIKGIVCYMENPSIPEIQNKFLQYPPLLSSKKEVMKLENWRGSISINYRSTAIGAGVPAFQALVRVQKYMLNIRGPHFYTFWNFNKIQAEHDSNWLKISFLLFLKNDNLNLKLLKVLNDQKKYTQNIKFVEIRMKK